MLEALCTDCEDHFQQVREALEHLHIDFQVNQFMVRGLDYYTRTTFEFLTTALGAQAAVGAGGRYDGLIEQLGGPALSGIGFAMGLERLALLMEQQSNQTLLAGAMDIFLAVLGSAPLTACSQLAHLLRRCGARTAIDYSGRSLKAQLKQANRTTARYTLILGEDEWARREALIRNMHTQEQQPFGLTGSPEEWSRRLIDILGVAPGHSDVHPN